ncbi:MAG: orotate phosphoribosyltransferase [Bdellovibrionota bacterium]
MTHQELAKRIYDISHLKGDFTLRSGQKSKEYFDKYRFEAEPLILKEIAEKMKSLIPSGTEILAALEMGGIPIGTALSLATGLPCVFVRKEAKSYGTCKLAEGLEIKNKKVCIVEDVITSGGQVLISTADLQKLGAQIENVLCVIHRGCESAEAKLNAAGLKLHPLFVRTDFPSSS